MWFKLPGVWSLVPAAPSRGPSPLQGQLPPLCSDKSPWHTGGTCHKSVEDLRGAWPNWTLCCPPGFLPLVLPPGRPGVWGPKGRGAHLPGSSRRNHRPRGGGGVASEMGWGWVGARARGFGGSSFWGGRSAVTQSRGMGPGSGGPAGAAQAAGRWVKGPAPHSHPSPLPPRPSPWRAFIRRPVPWPHRQLT